jgi:hypothetical protein
MQRRFGLAPDRHQHGFGRGFLLSPKLWLRSRLYPLTPVSAFLHPIPWPFDLLVFLALLLLL